LPGSPAPGEDRLARELDALHERARERLDRQLSVLERQREAVRAGNVRHVRELAGLEAAATAEVAAIERSIVAFGAARGGQTRSRLEHEKLRSLVLESNRRTRALLEEELHATARALVAHRARVGTPSPFSAIGEAALLDIRR
jgi:hypothetical protein